MNHRALLLGVVCTAWIGALAGLVTPARADVVAPPESGSCPDGTQAAQSHGLNPSACYPLNCTSDDECSSGRSCVEKKYCAYYTETCRDDADCENAAPCSAQRVCAEGCSIDGGSRPGASALLLLALLFGARRRRT